MKVVAVDTTSARGSVALVEGEDVLGEVRLLAPDNHSRVLLPAIELLLKAADLSPRDLDAFAVAVGPGSFTGIRVGLSTVQGLSLAAERPCLGASILDIQRAAAGEVEAPIVSLRDAFRGDVYWTLLEGTGEGAGVTRLSGFDEMLEDAPAGAAFVGEISRGRREAIAARVPAARFVRVEPFLAAALALWAEPRLRSGQGGGPESLRPLYVRPPDIRKAAP